MTKHITLTDFLTEDEIKQAERLWKQDKIQFRRRYKTQVIIPNMERINKQLGQDNDTDYLSLIVEYMMQRSYG
jgi:hypothetical protein